MATVKFNDVEEFLDELKKDADNVERKILRLTFRHRIGDLPQFRTITVVASALIGGIVVALESRSGSFMVGTKEADETIHAAKAKAAAIEATAGELGLEVRAGSYEAA